jgi:rhamnosyltransferase
MADAGIIHEHHETRQGVFNRYQREALAFKRIYPEAHFSLYDFARMTSANIASDLWHAFKLEVFLKSFPSIFWFRVAQFWGTYQGYRRSLEWNWNLRQTFYYPNGMEMPEKPASRQIAPIRYEK